ALELNTPYVALPGDPLVHHAAGFAKVMCSAVFITGLDPDFAAENVGYFTAPYEMRAKLGKPVVDREHNQVRVAVPDRVTRTAVYLGDQGCVSLPGGKDSISFKPVKLKSTLPNPSEQAIALRNELLRRGALGHHKDEFMVTPTGKYFLRTLNIDADLLYGLRRSFAHKCLDWTERQHHIGGAVGAALLSRLIDMKWLVRMHDTRAVRVTHAGE